MPIGLFTSYGLSYLDFIGDCFSNTYANKYRSKYN